MPESSCPVVTIDGPSGSGKGTISRALARRLSWHLLDSGALYRLVALAGAAAAAPRDDAAGHAALARAMRVRVRLEAGREERVRLDGRDVTS